ncbi:MAG: IS91 family transposase, partial [Acidiferrobacterales bacterium]
MSLNVHLHLLFLDGVYTFDNARPRFHRVEAPNHGELVSLLHTIASRVTRALDKQGLLIRDAEQPYLDLEPADGFEGQAYLQLLGSAIHYRIATGPHGGN